MTIPLPPREKQKEIVSSIKEKYARLNELDRARDDTAHDIQETVGDLFQLPKRIPKEKY
ncbi:MAG: hypothetical protein ACLP5V_15900 [Candidatus Bathyarchaeia archaeon]